MNMFLLKAFNFRKFSFPALALTALLVWGVFVGDSLWAQSLSTPIAASPQNVGALNTQLSIGSVTFVIGRATVERAGESVSLVAGSDLKVGDLLLTPVNGHVHIKFVDGALVSLRPSSSLKIVEYRYDPQNPAGSQVRFELEQGVVRAISGKAAESAKDKFRLNTPLAAIGVKGTDFVVEASGSRVNAIVNQGAIILAPFDALCSAQGLGPCSTMAARELSALSKGMAITYSSNMPTPVLLPTGQLKGSDLLNLVSPMSLGASAAVAVSSNNTGAAEGSNSGVNTSRVQQSQVDAKAYAEVNQILGTSAAQNTLVWGRWGSATPQDNLTIPFVNALQGRSVTVGDGSFFLFRTENNVPNLLSVEQGNVNFALQGSQAYFLDVGNNMHAASVTSGSLGINFSSLNFNTTLNVTSSPVSSSSPISQTLQSSGQINPSTGIFLSSSLYTSTPQGTLAQPTVAGAVSLDTRQAGYIFTLPSALGQFKGATLWGR
jgi:FecR protein